MPEDCIILQNNCGTAPGAIIENQAQDKAVVMLPGPPREMKPMFEECVVPYIEQTSEYKLVSINANIFGMGESAVENALGDLMKKAENPTVAPYCKEGEVRLRVTAMADDHTSATALCNKMIDEIRATAVGEYIYGVDIDSLERAAVELLKSRSLTLAMAESCTGGLISKRITDISGASEVFLGSCVTYANEAKVKLLGVSEKTLSEHGAVSEQTAREMARGVRSVLGCDIGVSVTGVAGPMGGTPEKPVGTVFVGVSSKDGEEVRRLSLSSMRSREYIRIVSASNALDMIMRVALGKVK
jgi:nicotinamide-nucleotide amidase